MNVSLKLTVSSICLFWASDLIIYDQQMKNVRKSFGYKVRHFVKF